MSIRNAAKAILLHEQKVLLNRCRHPELGEYFTLPGGGQHQYETMEEAVVRECLEETGYTVVPQACVALYEEIHADDAFRAKYPDYAHKIYHVFRCTLQCTERIAPLEPDIFELGSEWVAVEDVPNIRLLPEALQKRFTALLQVDAPLYMGTRRLRTMI